MDCFNNYHSIGRKKVRFLNVVVHCIKTTVRRERVFNRIRVLCEQPFVLYRILNDNVHSLARMCIIYDMFHCSYVNSPLMDDDVQGLAQDTLEIKMVSGDFIAFGTYTYLCWMLCT